MDKFEILVAGTGGQGVLVVGNMLDRAARFNGFDTVIGSEIHGMAQRGGPLVSYTRLGEDIHGPIIPIGGADVMICLECMEGLRNIEKLAEDGWMLISQTRLPSGAMWVADIAYPEEEAILSAIREVTDRVTVVDSAGIAKQVGNVRAANIVMLGATFAAVDNFPIGEESLRKAIKTGFSERLVDLNISAFEAGMEAAVK